MYSCCPSIFYELGRRFSKNVLTDVNQNASNTSQRETVSGSWNEDTKERSQKLSTVEQLEQACTSATEANASALMVKTHVATKVPTLHIVNNYGTIIVSANASKASDIGTHSTNQKAKVFNIKVTNNAGAIIAGENIELTVKEAEDKKNTPLYQLHRIVDQSMNDCLVNRSEFCPASIFDPNISEEM